VVDDGSAAVAAAVTGTYDAVLMDCQMPGMDGFEATEAIRRSEGKRIPIIALTASVLESDVATVPGRGHGRSHPEADPVRSSGRGPRPVHRDRLAAAGAHGRPLVTRTRSSIASAVAICGLLLAACGRGLPPPPEGARLVTIASARGEKLGAVELGQGGNVVVLSHGATGTKEGFYALASAFADDGWRVIAYDARGVGESMGTRGQDREGDLRAVVEHALETGGRRIVLVGGSLGAALSIAMAHELDARAVVSLSAPAETFGAIDAARELGGRVPAFVAAAEDNEPFAGDARRLAEALGVAPTIVSGDGHGSALLLDHPELIGAIVAFADNAIHR
jgi:CheY-like chemotaxis protein/pimeloyl-ACP methyl ester carboxylesterase